MFKAILNVLFDKSKADYLCAPFKLPKRILHAALQEFKRITFIKLQ